MKTLVKVMTGLLLVGVCSSAMAEWASGEIRRLDPENKRLTIKHGDIKSIDMPPMTMVFYVNESSLLEGFHVQDAVEFKATAEGNKYIVTAIRKKVP
ncbi:MAG: copper-binding protein [Burkholderiaceae bacterium]